MEQTGPPALPGEEDDAEEGENNALALLIPLVGRVEDAVWEMTSVGNALASSRSSLSLDRLWS